MRLCITVADGDGIEREFRGNVLLVRYNHRWMLCNARTTHSDSSVDRSLARSYLCGVWLID